MRYRTLGNSGIEASVVLVGARNGEQAIANAKAGEIELTPVELRELRNAVETLRE